MILDRRALLRNHKLNFLLRVFSYELTTSTIFIYLFITSAHAYIIYIYIPSPYTDINTQQHCHSFTRITTLYLINTHRKELSLVMSQYDQQEAAAYPAPPTSHPPRAAYVMAPPPMGYPTRDAHNVQDPAPAPTTTSRGGGFLKGW